jgi:predicted glycosyltransferase involved in capsule biosynthesis
VAQEEALHFTLIREHLRKLGIDYGDLPAHQGLWEHAQDTADDLLARLWLQLLFVTLLVKPFGAKLYVLLFIIKNTLGFRTFFALSGLSALVLMVVWRSLYDSSLVMDNYYVNNYWHAHEMLLGYAVAVIAE